MSDALSWRIQPKEQVEENDNSKHFLNLCKKIREVKKIESQGTGIEANQKTKVAGKRQLMEELSNLPVCRAEWFKNMWQKNEDLWEYLDADIREKIEKSRADRDLQDGVKPSNNSPKNQLPSRSNSIDVTNVTPRNANETDLKLPRVIHNPSPTKVSQNFVNRHERPVTDLVVDTRHSVVYSSCKDKSIVRWNVMVDEYSALDPVTTLCGHEGAVYCVDVAEEADRVVSGGADGYLLFWDANPSAGKTVAQPTKGVYSKGNQGTKRVQTPLMYIEYGGIIRGLRASPSKGICLWTDKLIRTPAHMAVLSWEDPTQVLWKTTDFICKINMMLWNNVGGTKVFTAHDDGFVRVWGSPVSPTNTESDSPPEPRLLKELQAHEKGIISLNWHKHFLLTASDDCKVKAINTNLRDMPTTYEAKANRPLRAVAAWDFPEDKCFSFIYGGGRDPKDVTTSNLLCDEFEFYQSWIGEYQSTQQTKNASAGPLHRLLWLKDQERIVSAGEDGEVKLWEHEGLQQYIQRRS